MTCLEMSSTSTHIFLHSTQRGFTFTPTGNTQLISIRLFPQILLRQDFSDDASTISTCIFLRYVSFTILLYMVCCYTICNTLFSVESVTPWNHFLAMSRVCHPYLHLFTFLYLFTLYTMVLL